ncbi:MAG: TetR/AcrR family transcriptional regulator [Acidobacteriota bacterium]
MNQDERSERSRAAILGAALQLFSHQGYRGTAIRDIADKAGVSTGSVYHHFSDKESIFETLLGEFWRAADAPDFPLNRVMTEGAFPLNVELIGCAAREVISTWRSHVALIYVDVVEFDGRHIRKFYADVADRCARLIEQNRDVMRLDEVIRPGVPPATALLMTIRIFTYFFVVELLFNVPNSYGMSSDEAVAAIADILKHGMLRQS